MLTLYDVDIETASQSELTVVAGSPASGEVHTSLRVTGPRGHETTLLVQAVRCVPVLRGGHRRYRVTYRVLSQGAGDR